MTPGTATPLADALRRTTSGDPLSAARRSTSSAPTLIPSDPRLHELLEHTLDAAVLVDATGTIVATNSPARDALDGIGPGLAIDQLWVQPAPPEALSTALPRTIREGRWHGRLPMPWHGTSIEVEQSLFGHHTPEGRLVAISVIGAPASGAPRPTLANAIAAGTHALNESVALAASAARAVAAVHRHGLVHRGISPSAFVLGDQPGSVFITGFETARPLRAGVTAAPEWDGTLDGPLAYVSPEQTGRVNRAVDCRSDLYSLGAVLYELLTGSTPLTADDPLEWVHAHVARVPPTLRERVPNLPAAIDEIVMRLLAKDPEDRYQSAAGLVADLDRCVAELEDSGTIPPFLLGARDISDVLQVPQRLYGREQHLESLTAALDRVTSSGEAELALVAGPGGIGKSTLVQALRETVTRAGGVMISGSFGAQQRGVPYAPFAEAINELVQQSLALPPAQLQQHRERLQDRVGVHGAVITDLVPRAALVLGEMPPAPPIPFHETQARAHRVIGSFLDAHAQERPVVLVLDDLQWADPATLQLVADLLDHARTRRILIVGTYRDDALSPEDPLTSLTLEPGLARTTIQLQQLTIASVRQLLADTLGTTPQRVAELAVVVTEKTGGNPYYLMQFIDDLHRDGLISNDRSGGGWQWDSERAASAAVTDNVVDLMSGRLQALPDDTQRVLAVAAFLGSPFDRRSLAAATGHTERSVETDLWDAMRQRLVLARGDGYRFSHDRVEQAAYELVPAHERAELHLEIGRRLLTSMSPDELEERVFTIAGHINRGRELVVDPRERYDYAALGLRAGRKAIATAAHRSARDYLATALDLLPATAWETDFRLAFDVRLELARCEHLGGDIEAADALAGELIDHAEAPEDIAGACALRIELLLARSEPGAAAEAGVLGWRRLGLPIEDHPSYADGDRSVERIWALLGDRPIEDLLTLPPASDQTQLASITLFGPLLTSAFLAERHDLAIYLMAENTRLSLVHGNTPASLLLHALFGSLLAGRFGRYDDGRRLGHAAYEIIQRAGILPLAAQTAVYVGNTTYWTDPFSACLPFFRTGFDAGVRAGDLAHAGFCALFGLIMRYSGGDSLDDIEREAEPLFAFADDMKLPENRDALLIVERTVQSLRGRTDEVGKFGSDTFDEADYLNRMWTERPPFYHAILTIHQASAYVFGRRIEEGLEAADRFDKLRGALAFHALMGEAEPTFALARAAAWDDAPHERKLALRERVAQAQSQLEVWASHSPANFRARADLLGAELARIDGDHERAAKGYERAVAAATEHGIIHHEALARELEGRFYLGRGLTSVAHACLREARDRYERWGAAGKTAELEAEFPGVLGSRAGKPRTPEVDMLAVVRGSQAISGELDLEQLPTTLLRIAVAAGGAQAGHLLRVSNGIAEVAAVAQVEHETVHVTLPGDGGAEVPRSVVDYVVRTGERVLLRDARADAVFGHDEVIVAGGVRSLLAQPIVRHGSVVGLLVLEHRLVTDAFTPQRLTAVEMLAAQAAISVETAQLYQEVREENRVRRRTEEELRASGEQFRSLVESAPDAILITDSYGHVVLVNSRAEQLFGLDRDQLTTRMGEQLVPEIEWTGRPPAADAAAGIEVERRGVASDGTTFPVEVTLSPLERPEGPWTIAVVRDVTERKRLEQELEQAADHDALTGLLNRARLERELDAAIENVERSRSVAVLLVLDLDRIRDINDSLGPGVGDELISGVAAAIAERIRPTDTLARLDGDEFALILSRTDVAGAEVLAEELLTLVREFSLERDGTFVRTTASVGIAPITTGADTAQSLLAAADVALNEAKENGRDRVSTYTQDSHRRASERHTWSERIRRALEHDHFTLHAQPILDLRTGRTTHAELLIRMEDDGTLIAPGEFLPTAERTGSITAIDRWVIREAARLAAAQPDGLLELNLSARSLADLELPVYIEQELERAGADPSSLIFEITETAAIANLASAASLAERLTSLGCRFALDDFGVGFGSFYYLKRLPLHYIKIDGDFIQSLTRSQTDQHVTKAIVDVAQGMGLKTIAEFVEDAETLDLLRTYGVDYAQGFHIGRPAQIEEPGA